MESRTYRIASPYCQGSHRHTLVRPSHSELKSPFNVSPYRPYLTPVIHIRQAHAGQATIHCHSLSLNSSEIVAHHPTEGCPATTREVDNLAPRADDGLLAQHIFHPTGLNSISVDHDRTNPRWSCRRGARHGKHASCRHLTVGGR